MNINLERIRKASKNIYVNGRIAHNVDGDDRNEGKGGRLKVIEEAIADIMENGETAMGVRFFGMKNYSAFGDQRCDCEYGMGPRHGSIVFSVGRTDHAKGEKVQLGEDEVYLLECVRDFGDVTSPEAEGEKSWHKEINLLTVIKQFDQHTEKAKKYNALLEKASVESHAMAGE